MKRIDLPNETNLQGLQFSQADNRALMELLIGVTTNTVTDTDRSYAKTLLLRYCYFLSELEREQQPTEPASGPKAKAPRPDLRQAPMFNRKKRRR